MVFNLATYDPAEDSDDFNALTPSSSPSVTLCQPCEYTYTFTKAIISRLVAAGASRVLKVPAFETDGHEIQDESAETQFYSISSDVRPKLHQRQLKEFTLKELKAATRKFSNEKVIGVGGFGIVYEGQLADGSLVAIKRLGKDSRQGMIEFEAEVMFGSIEPQHHNLLSPLGYCKASKCRELLLVSPLMINKSAASCLRERPETQPPLDWPTRRKIALGTARGLSHLHDLNIVHRDIKPSNILLDEEFEPHLGDFGIAVFIDRKRGECSVDCIEEAPPLPRKESEEVSHSKYSHVTTRLMGTFGYLDPEYFMTGKCSVKTDVYSFGIVLLELVTGQRAIDHGRHENSIPIRCWVEGHLLQHGCIETLVDPDMRCEFDRAEVEKMIELAFWCTQETARERPNMAEVVRILEGHSIDNYKRRGEDQNQGWAQWMPAGALEIQAT